MNMIEKVARAMYDDYEVAKKMGMKKAMHNTARKAIAAMREPTDEMLIAFYGEIGKDRWLAKDWQDMIDAALKE